MPTLNWLPLDKDLHARLICMVLTGSPMRETEYNSENGRHYLTTSRKRATFCLLSAMLVGEPIFQPPCGNTRGFLFCEYKGRIYDEGDDFD